MMTDQQVGSALFKFDEKEEVSICSSGNNVLSAVSHLSICRHSQWRWINVRVSVHFRFFFFFFFF